MAPVSFVLNTVEVFLHPKRLDFFQFLFRFTDWLLHDVHHSFVFSINKMPHSSSQEAQAQIWTRKAACAFASQRELVQLSR